MTSPCLKKIQDTLAAADRPLFPKEISSMAGLNHSTVRVYLRRLLKEGLVKQPFRGVYESIVTKPTYVEGPPRVQDLRLRVKRAVPVKFADHVEEYGQVRIRVKWGTRRQQITGTVSCPQGLDLESLSFAVHRFKVIAGGWEGVLPRDSEVEVVSVELLHDYEDLRLDGLKCVTLRSFLGSLEKIYNKDPGLRAEVKVKPDKIESIYALLRGGVTQYNLIQSSFAIDRRLEDLTAAIKHQNVGLTRVCGLLEAVLERLSSRDQGK